MDTSQWNNYWFVNWLCARQQQCLHLNGQHTTPVYRAAEQRQQLAGKYAAKTKSARNVTNEHEHPHFTTTRAAWCAVQTLQTGRNLLAAKTEIRCKQAPRHELTEGVLAQALSPSGHAKPLGGVVVPGCQQQWTPQQKKKSLDYFLHTSQS